MIINLFEKSDKIHTKEKSGGEISQANVKQKAKQLSKKLNISDIQKYIIDNYIDYIKQEKYDLIKEKTEKYIYEQNPSIDKNLVESIKKQVINKMFGYHILQKYIDDEKVSDIRVVRYNQIYIKKLGQWIKVADSFESEQEFLDYVRYCVLKNNSNINFDTPIVTVSDKKYNLRIEAGIPPANPISPSLVIRIHRHNLGLTLEKLFVKDQMLDAYSYLDILEIIKNKKSIVICGKGGSGKTTLLRAIIDIIPDQQAITTNEETIELYINNKNIIQREVINNREKSKNISLDMLTTHSLVMSNDVIVIGELKNFESAQFFDAIATGHQGLTTLHCDSATAAIDRLVILIKKNTAFQQYKEEFIERMLANSLDYIIFMKDYKVAQIAEVKYQKDKGKVEFDMLYDIHKNQSLQKLKKEKEKLKEKVKENNKEVECIKKEVKING